MIQSNAHPTDSPPAPGSAVSLEDELEAGLDTFNEQAAVPLLNRGQVINNSLSPVHSHESDGLPSRSRAENEHESEPRQTLGSRLTAAVNSVDWNAAGETAKNLAEEMAVEVKHWLLGPAIWTLLKWTLIITGLVTAAIVYRLKGNPPRESIDGLVNYTSRFQMEVPRDVPNAALWNETEVKNEKKNTVQLLAEFHTHTTHSDGRLTPAQVVDWARAYAFDVLFVTDHNTLSGGLAAKRIAEATNNDPGVRPLLVIPGIEYTCCRIHMNLLGINETIAPTSSWPSDIDLEFVIARTHEQGGVVVVNHLPWSMSLEWGRDVPTLQRHPTREQLTEWGVDSFESVSEGVLDLATTRWVHKNGMPYVTATDLHDPETAPSAWTVLNIPQSSVPDGSSPANITAETVLSVLRRGNKRLPGSSTNFYYDPVGPSHKVYSPHNPSSDWYLPLTRLDLTYFWSESNGMYSFVDGFCHTRVFEFKWRAAVAFVGWAFLVFLVCESVVGLVGFVGAKVRGQRSVVLR